MTAPKTRMTALANLESALRGCVEHMEHSTPQGRAAYEQALAALSPAELGGVDYVPGELDRTAPPRIWLQIDSSGDNDSRDELWPGPDHVTWQDESIGGLEIEYVRADLSTPRADEAKVLPTPEDEAGAKQDFTARTVPHPDSIRLNWLEHMARTSGLLLHCGDYNRTIKTAPGLGLLPGKVDRTLRQAIDEAAPEAWNVAALSPPSPGAAK